MKSTTFRLFKQMPSFVGGVAAAIDFGAPIHDNFNFDETPTEADFNALASDWRTIGDDMRNALFKHDKGA